MGEDARGIEGVGAYGWGAMQQWSATNDLTDRPFSVMEAQGIINYCRRCRARPTT